MAAFEVPIATGLFTGIPHDIATAPGAMLPGQAIGNLPDAYWAGQNQAYQQRLRNLFQNGVPGNLGDVATQLAQAKGADAIPEYIALKNREAADVIAARPVPSGVVDTGAPSGYTAPGPQTSNAPAEPALSPTAGTATPRQIAEARGVPLEQVMRAAGTSNPDASLDYDQRKALVDNLSSGATAAPPAGPRVAQAGATTTVPSAAQTIANRFPSTTAPLGTMFPPSVGAPNPARPQAAPAPPAQVAQVAQAPAQASPIQAPADPQAVLIERTAAANAQRAAFYRKQQEDFARAGDAVSAKSAGETAGVYEGRANEAYKALLDRSKPPTASIEARDPAIISSAALKTNAEKDSEAYNKDLGTAISAARAVPLGLQRVEEMKNLTAQPTFYSGPLNKAALTFQQYRAAFGRDPTTAQPIEAFNKGVKDIVTEQIRSLSQSGVGRIVLAEVKNIQNAVASPEISRAGNRSQLETLRRTYVLSDGLGQVADQVNQDVAQGRVPAGQYRTYLAAKMDEYAKANPVFTAEEIKHPQLLGAVDAPAAITRLPKAEVQAWSRQHGVSPGDPLHMPDGTYIKAP